MANSDVDGGALPAGGRRLSERPADVEWTRLAPLIPPTLPRGRPRKTDMRAAVSAILCLCGPAAPGVICRATAFRQARPSTICASEWVGRPAPRRRFSTASRSNRPKRGGNDNQVGYDAGKEVKGRKIHALVYSEELPMRVVVHSAAIQDRDGAGLVLDKIRRRFPCLDLIWAEGVYNAWQVDAAVERWAPGDCQAARR
jgi:transposase